MIEISKEENPRKKKKENLMRSNILFQKELMLMMKMTFLKKKLRKDVGFLLNKD